MTDPAAGLSILHVVVRASDTNSQYNEHCLPVRHQRRITVCSLFPATVVAPPEIELVEGDGTVRGCFRALHEALGRGRYDAVHVHAAASALVTLLVYLRRRRPRQDLVFTIHNSWQNFRRRNRLLLWLVAARFPVLVACGAAAHATLPRGLRLLARRLEVIPNGVDLDRVDSVLRTTGPQEDPVRRTGSTALAVNRLIAIKNPEAVMEAFVRGADPHDTLVMVGDGNLSDRLATAVEEAGLQDQLRLTGPVPRDEVYRHMRRAAVFVSASAGEGLPVSVLEAMACRCPVVLSDIAPHREIARHTEAVCLVDTSDQEQFAEAIRRALRRSSFGRYLVGDELRRTVERHFSVTTMNESYGRLYRSVAQAAATQAARDDVTTRRARSLRLSRLGAAALLGALAATWYGGMRAPGYDATTTLAVKTLDPSASSSQVRARSLGAAGLADMARRQVILEPVAKRLRLPDWRRLPARVQADVGVGTPPVIEVTATASTARGAEQLSAAVADQLRAVTSTRTPTGSDQTFVSRELARLRQEMARTQLQIDARLGQPREAATADGALALAALREQLAQLQSTYRSMLDWRDASQASQGLTVVEQPRARSSSFDSPVLQAIAGGLAGPALLVALSTMVAAARQEQRGAVTSPGQGPEARHARGSLRALPASSAARAR